MLANLSIILQGTSLPANIGSSIRAMVTMGCNDLTLVQPKIYPHPDIDALAANALQHMQSIRVTDSIEKALADNHLVVGTSARVRTDSLPVITPDECAKLYASNPDKKLAILFGPERTGLTNDTLMRCNYQLTINANPIYPVMNLAAAVQIVCYEIWQASQRQKPAVAIDPKLATSNDRENFYQHFQQVLVSLDFSDQKPLTQTMARIRKIFNPLLLEKSEMNLLRGILNKVKKYVKH